MASLVKKCYECGKEETPLEESFLEIPVENGSILYQCQECRDSEEDLLHVNDSDGFQ